MKNVSNFLWQGANFSASFNRRFQLSYKNRPQIFDIMTTTWAHPPSISQLWWKITKTTTTTATKVSPSNMSKRKDEKKLFAQVVIWWRQWAFCTSQVSQRLSPGLITKPSTWKQKSMRKNENDLVQHLPLFSLSFSTIFIFPSLSAFCESELAFQNTAVRCGPFCQNQFQP